VNHFDRAAAWVQTHPLKFFLACLILYLTTCIGGC
jgi:hypothetical protein